MFKQITVSFAQFVSLTSIVLAIYIFCKYGITPIERDPLVKTRQLLKELYETRNQEDDRHRRRRVSKLLELAELLEADSNLAEMLENDSKLAPMAVPLLVDFLSSKDKMTQYEAAGVLRHCGPSGIVALPPLAKVACDPNVEEVTRLAFISAIGGILSHSAGEYDIPEQILDDLAVSARDANPNVRIFTYSCMLHLPASEAVETLFREGVGDPDSSVRFLAKIGLEGKQFEVEKKN